MVHVPMCEWCGEQEVGSISGGSTRFCSVECDDAAVDARGRAEQEAEGAFYDPHGDDGRWDDDPSPYGGTYSED